MRRGVHGYDNYRKPFNIKRSRERQKIQKRQKDRKDRKDKIFFFAIKNVR